MLKLTHRACSSARSVALLTAAVLMLTSAVAAQVANDTCETATLIDEGVVSGNNFLAQNDLPASFCNFLDGPFVQDVWYRFEAEQKGWLTATFGCNGADFDTGLFLFQSCSDPQAFACNDDTCGTNSQLKLMFLPSQPLLIAVAGYSGLGKVGTFNLKVTVDRVSQFIPATSKVGDGLGGFLGPWAPGDDFGEVASLGDFDGNGVPDVAVGSPGMNDGVADSGAVFILRQSADGTVLSHSQISNSVGGLDFSLPAGCGFGASLAGLGDLDGDGTPDLVVGAPLDEGFGGTLDAGAIRILRLRPNGSIKSLHKVTDGMGWPGSLDPGDRFGSGLAAPGPPVLH